MLYVVDERGNKLWEDDAWDFECKNKAEDFITSESRMIVKEEITLSGNMILWTTRIGD